MPKLTKVKAVKEMTPREREAYKRRLNADLAEAKSRIAGIQREILAIREAEEIPGFVTVNEYLSNNAVELSSVERSRLGDHLQKAADQSEWDQGQKTVKTNTKARVARHVTYRPSVIKTALARIQSMPR